jgi:hypothetical protein
VEAFSDCPQAKTQSQETGSNWELRGLHLWLALLRRHKVSAPSAPLFCESTLV